MCRSLMCRVGGWFLWGSLGALVGVIVVGLVSPVVATRSGDAGSVLMDIIRVQFAVMAGAFLLGMGCHLTEGLADRLGGERQR